MVNYLNKKAPEYTVGTLFITLKKAGNYD